VGEGRKYYVIGKWMSFKMCLISHVLLINSIAKKDTNNLV
jgi:hypothetical protein